MTVVMGNNVRSSAFDRWLRFTAALESDVIDLLGTEDVVAALLDRSLVQDELDAGLVLDPDRLIALDAADRTLKGAAPTLLDRTDISLFRDDEPVSHWWWHIEQLVLGHAGSALLTVPEAARTKGVHPHTIRAAIRGKALPARTLARGFLIHRRDLERWEPRRVGRPRGSRAGAADALLEAFNDANTSRDFARADDIARAIARQPTSPRRQLALALSAYNAGDSRGAIKWAKRALAGDLPALSRQTALLVLGRAQLVAGSAKQALTAFRRAQGLASLDGLVYAAIADAHLADSDPATAVAWAHRALAADSSRPELKYVAARMEWHHDLVWDALEHIVEYRSLRDDVEGSLLHCAILGYLGDQLADPRCYERALAILDASRASGIDSLITRVVALSRLGRTPEAVDALSRLVVLAENDDNAQAAVDNAATAVVHSVVLADPDSAAVTLDQIDSVAGRAIDASRRARAFLWAQRGEVRTVYEMVGSEDPDDPFESLLVAIALTEQGDTAPATSAFRKLVDRTDDPDILQAAIIGGAHLDNLEIIQRALEKIAPLQTTGGWANTAIGILATARRVGRAEAVSSAIGPFADIRDVAIAASASGGKPADSVWEGVHHRVSPVFQSLTLARVH